MTDLLSVFSVGSDFRGGSGNVAGGSPLAPYLVFFIDFFVCVAHDTLPFTVRSVFDGDASRFDLSRDLLRDDDDRFADFRSALLCRADAWSLASCESSSGGGGMVIAGFAR